MPTSLVPRSVDADLRACLLLRFPCFIPDCPLKDKRDTVSPQGTPWHRRAPPRRVREGLYLVSRVAGLVVQQGRGTQGQVVLQRLAQQRVPAVTCGRKPRVCDFVTAFPSLATSPQTFPLPCAGPMGLGNCVRTGRGLSPEQTLLRLVTGDGVGDWVGDVMGLLS